MGLSHRPCSTAWAIEKDKTSKQFRQVRRLGVSFDGCMECARVGSTQTPAVLKDHPALSQFISLSLSLSLVGCSTPPQQDRGRRLLFFLCVCLCLNRLDLPFPNPGHGVAPLAPSPSWTSSFPFPFSPSRSKGPPPSRFSFSDLDAPHQTSFQVKRSKNSKISASDVTIFRFSGFQVGAAEEEEKET